MAQTMKALVIRGPMKYALEDLAVPDIPDGGLLLKVQACGLCGSDLRTLRNGHRKVTFPWIVGHEICGTVVATGDAYSGRWQVDDDLAVGPLAYCGECDFCVDGRYELCENYREIAQAWPGGFSEYIAIPEACLKLGTIQPAPLNLAPAYAAISEPISSCVHAQEVGQVGLGETVVIIGAGPVGCIHASLARARGANKVFIADISEQRLAMAQDFCPDALINAAETDLVTEVRRLTAGKGADVIITATPAPVSQVQAVEMARKGGRVLLFGGLPKDKAKPGVDMNTVHYNALHLIGTTIYAPRHQRIALDLMSTNKIPVDKLVTHTFPLSHFHEGVSLALAGDALKVVFLPGA